MLDFTKDIDSADMFEIFYNFYGLNQKIFLLLNQVTNKSVAPYFLKIISFFFNISTFAMVYTIYCLYLCFLLSRMIDIEQKKNFFWYRYNQVSEIGVSYTFFVLVFFILKYTVNLPRPFCSLPLSYFATIIDIGAQRCLSSFPSSHVGLSVLVTYFSWRYIGTFGKLLMILLVILVSLARISFAMHYPADIFYGIVITIVIILFGRYIYKLTMHNIIEKIGNYIYILIR